MLDELPSQYIEGINENVELHIDDDHIIVMRSFKKIAIKYTPKISSLVSHINLPILNNDKECIVPASIYSDYNNNPGVQLLGDENSSIQTTNPFAADWQSINLQPVVLVSGVSYWLVLNIESGVWVLPVVTNVSEPIATPVRISRENRWTYYRNENEYPIMLRAYGKVLPK